MLWLSVRTLPLFLQHCCGSQSLCDALNLWHDCNQSMAQLESSLPLLVNQLLWWIAYMLCRHTLAHQQPAISCIGWYTFVSVCNCLSFFSELKACHTCNRYLEGDVLLMLTRSRVVEYQVVLDITHHLKVKQTMLVDQPSRDSLSLCMISHERSFDSVAAHKASQIWLVSCTISLQHCRVHKC